VPKRLKLFATEAIAGCSQLVKRNFWDEIRQQSQVLLKELIESELKLDQEAYLSYATGPGRT